MAQLLASTIDGNLTVNGTIQLDTQAHRATTRQKLNYFTENPHGGVNNDTTAVWASLGSGWQYVSAGSLANQPISQGGFLQNMVSNDGVVFQVFYAMDGNGSSWTRSGNTSGWHLGSANWIRTTNSNNIFKVLWNNGTVTEDGTMSGITDLMKYRLYAIEFSGHGTFVLAMRYSDDYVRGIGGYANDNNTNFSYHVGATITNNTTLKIVSCNYMYHKGSDVHGSNNTKLDINCLIGIV